MKIELEKQYDPHQAEDHWSRYWEENGYYRADAEQAGPPYSIVIPPPNITGSLHIGHAFNNTLQDILTRWKRMLGFNALWQPGTDHAGIATQNVVERQLRAEGTDRQTLGRDAFIERIWTWRKESGGTIERQLRKLGASLDWERNRFTMDDGLSKAVREVFVSLYEEGLIYKGDYIINWCPRCHTALSDLEVEHQEKLGALYEIRYPVKGSDEHLIIATTRPETLLGDTAVAINPEDERHTGMKGKTLILPLLNREIPIIEDAYVDLAFGTGALKVTPAHDPNDFELGRRHQLESINVLTPDAAMNENAGAYQGLDRFDCRKKIVEDLQEQGLLVSVEDHMHSVGHCYRCKTVVEPYLSKQWFVRAKPLAEPAIQAVRDGSIEIIPKFWENTYFEWMENIRDWCISRQIWWGHQIPAWFCSDCDKMTVSREDPEQCEHCGSKQIERESDVLDTWFSSALWPFSTLGWPEKTKSLETYYPTSLLCTGFDILFFWVARMVMMGLKFMGEVPFKQVYIHALVRDAEGQKMSKTKGNVIDPLAIMSEYGTDALRFTLAAFAAQGRDVKLAEDRIEGYRNFCNKIWNASRFIFMNLEDYSGTTRDLKSATLATEDRWILSRLNAASKEINQALDNFKFNEAAMALYKFIWHEFCDWYIELSKPRLFKTGDEKKSAQEILLHVLESSLRLMHPFMPFISEEIWQKLPGSSGSIMKASYPTYDEAFSDEAAEKEMELFMNVVAGVRNIRGEMNINPGLKLRILIKTGDAWALDALQKHGDAICKLARLETLECGPEIVKPKGAASSVVDGMDLFAPLEGVIDFADEKKRVEKELKKIQKEWELLDKKLSNPNFVDKAPAEVVAKDTQRKDDLAEKRERLDTHLKTVSEALG
ncbi:MAG: valine--tRNA ligase [Candidatus Nitrohelix vancouverensis]|uniref:Valine--tRNA ligase n=1 Tax=Candidatus Nitrohelix vancouverensis TaxID=2705534 RepID=A0A7T0G257_9BACT|nr:MAG: valine--tRNA ligase [Candidatus Nitrohelix vancouverensis]